MLRAAQVPPAAMLPLAQAGPLGVQGSTRVVSDRRLHTASGTKHTVLQHSGEPISFSKILKYKAIREAVRRHDRSWEPTRHMA
jgi:hypothetical protein